MSDPARTADHAALLAAARAVPDPEIPVLTLGDLGVIRDLRVAGDGAVEVDITPTYTGCPATAVIASDVQAALSRARRGPGPHPDGAVAAVDDRLDEPGGPEQAAPVRHLTAWTSRARLGSDPAGVLGPLPAVRFARHQGDQPLRLDSVQGPVDLPVMRGAI